MTKKELQDAYNALEEKFDILQQDYDILNENYNDLLASRQAYISESKKIKDSLKKVKDQLKDQKAKAASQTNRANQVAMRKKELEHELNVYRTTIDTYGDKLSKLASMTDLHFKNINSAVEPERWFFLPQVKKSFRKILKISNDAQSEIQSYI